MCVLWMQFVKGSFTLELQATGPRRAAADLPKLNAPLARREKQGTSEDSVCCVGVFQLSIWDFFSLMELFNIRLSC